MVRSFKDVNGKYVDYSQGATFYFYQAVATQLHALLIVWWLTVLEPIVS